MEPRCLPFGKFLLLPSIIGPRGFYNTTRVTRGAGRDEVIRVCLFDWGIWENVMSSSIF